MCGHKKIVPSDDQGVSGWMGCDGRRAGHEVRMALENRIYERQGQAILVHERCRCRRFPRATHFAQAIAAGIGGVFLKLPETRDTRQRGAAGRIQSALPRSSASCPQNSAEYVVDNDLDKRERADLEDVAQQIHRTVQELLALMFSVYCRPSVEAEQ